MKRSLPSSPPTGLPPDQEQLLLQQQLQGMREERGPGGSLITTGTTTSGDQPIEQQQGGADAGMGEPASRGGYYRSESTTSVNSYYSTSSTNTTFGVASTSGGGGVISGGIGDVGGSQRESSFASLSSLDCFNSIGSSLKRVKISTSPGELRLNKDIEAMAHNKLGGLMRNGSNGNNGTAIQWISIDEPGSVAAGAGSTSGNSGGTSNSSGGCTQYHKALRSSDGTIVVRRDVVDPLRLRISVTFRMIENPWQMVGWGIMAHNNTQNDVGGGRTPSNVPHASSSSCYETWNYLVQIPRMYPHSPPLIVRITREGGMSSPSTIPELVRQQRQEQQQQLQQQQRQQQSYFQQVRSFQQYSSENTAERGSHAPVLESAAAAAAAPLPAVPSGSATRPSGPPMVERIIVSSNPSIHPPSAEEGEMTGICVDSDALNEGSDPLTSTLATYGGWSPISRLSDLVTFLAELPAKRLEAWTAARSRSAGVGGNANVASNISAGYHHQHQSQQQFQSDSYLQHEERRLGEDGSRRGVVRRHISSNHYAYNDYSDMDTGEPTMGDAGGRPSHLDRQRRRTSQESEVDVSAIRLAGSSHSGSEQDVTAGVSSRMPATLEEAFHPNRFDQGFDRNGTASSLWRSASAPDVASQSIGNTAPSMTPGPGQQIGWGPASTAADIGPIMPPGHSSFDARFRQSSTEDSMIDDDL